MPKKITTFDIVLFIIPLIFAVTSIAVIYSLVFNTSDSTLVFKQVTASLIGIAAMVASGFMDYRLFRGTNWIFYLITVVLLVVVDFFGKTAGGAKSWLDLGFFNLQPSELAKIATIFSLASFFSNRIGKMQWKDVILSFVIMAPILTLVLTQPDLGTALVILFIYFSLLFVAKPTRTQNLVISGIILLASASLVLAAYKVGPFTHLLKDYQRARILTFVSSDYDPYGRSYNVRQAQISVGSGGLLGKGLGHGTQSQLQFLPEPHTDFIFAGIAESFGFVGSALFLLLYLYLILKIIGIAHVAQDNFGMMVVMGVASMFLFQVVVNVGMNLGVAPVTGIPLPLLSYGGTAMVVALFLTGVTQSVFIRHKKISF
ncbi:MAG: Rod shape-determining protein RodA [bacterium ADurb.Bin400]|nr:MAG: Rod shape-determining protein RodA [bacterium ADurb.Bin400]